MRIWPTQGHCILPEAQSCLQTTQHGPVVTTDAQLPAEEERSKLYAQKALSIIGYMLLTASDQPAPAHPFFPTAIVIAAIFRLPGQTTQKNKDILYGQVHHYIELMGDISMVLHESCIWQQTCCMRSNGKTTAKAAC